MSAARTVTRRSGLGLLSLLLTAACASGAAFAQSARDNQTLKEQTLDYWVTKMLAPPASQDPAVREAQAPLPESQRVLVQRELKAWGGALRNPREGHGRWWEDTLGRVAPSLGLGNLRAPHAEGTTGGWPSLQDSSNADFVPLPTWFLDAVAREVKTLSFVERPRPPGTRPAAAWRYDDTPSEAFVWAGPAVRDGAATYRAAGDSMTVRLPMPGARAPEIRAWAMQQGRPFQLELVRDGQPAYANTPLLTVGRTAIPVWLVHPEGLVPATLTAFASGGDDCDGSQWIEISYPGSAMLPVWAVLGFADPGLARDVVVRRLPRPQPEAELAYQEARRSEIELRWSADRLPALRIAARRFDWAQTDYEEQPDGSHKERGRTILGSAWATQVFTAMPAALAAQHPDEKQLMISSAGTPNCPPP